MNYQNEFENSCIASSGIDWTLDMYNLHTGSHTNIANEVCNAYDETLDIDSAELTEKGIVLHNVNCFKWINIVGASDQKKTVITGTIEADSPIAIFISDPDGIIFKDVNFKNITAVKALSVGPQDNDKFCYTGNCNVEIAGLFNGIKHLEVESNLFLVKTGLSLDYLKFSGAHGYCDIQCIQQDDVLNVKVLEIEGEELRAIIPIKSEVVKVKTTGQIDLRAIESNFIELTTDNEARLGDCLVHGDLLLSANLAGFLSLKLDGKANSKCDITTKFLKDIRHEAGNKKSFSGWTIGDTGSLYDIDLKIDKSDMISGGLILYGNGVIAFSETTEIPSGSKFYGNITIISSIISIGLEVTGQLKIVAPKITKDSTHDTKFGGLRDKITLTSINVVGNLILLGVPVFEGKNEISGSLIVDMGIDLSLITDEDEKFISTFKSFIYGSNTGTLTADKIYYTGNSFTNYGVIEVVSNFIISLAVKFDNYNKIKAGNDCIISTFDFKNRIDSPSVLQNQINIPFGGAKKKGSSSAEIKCNYIEITAANIENLDGSKLISETDIILKAKYDIQNLPIKFFSRKSQAEFQQSVDQNHQEHFHASIRALSDWKIGEDSKERIVGWVKESYHDNSDTAAENREVIQFQNNPQIIAGRNYVRITQEGEIVDIGVEVTVKNGKMYVGSATNIKESALTTTAKNIQIKSHGAKYYVNGVAEYDAKNNIIQIGTSKLVSGDIIMRAGNNIIQSALSVVKTISADYSTAHVQIRQEISTILNVDISTGGEVRYYAGENYKGSGNVIGALKGIKIEAKNSVDLRAATKYAINHESHFKRNGKLESALTQVISDTAVVQLISNNDIQILSAGRCKLEGANIGASQGGSAQNVKIICNQGVDIVDHKVKHHQYVYSNQERKVTFSSPLINTLKAENPAQYLIDNIGVVRALQQVSSMKGPKDLAGLFHFAAEIHGFKEAYNYFLNDKGFTPGNAFLTTLLSQYISAQVIFGVKRKGEAEIDATTSTSSSINGKNVDIEASGGTVKVSGSDINGGDITLKGKEIELNSAQEVVTSKQKFEESRFHCGIGLSGINIGYSKTTYKQFSEEIKHRKSHINGKNINIIADEKLDIIGAVVDGEVVDVNAAKIGIADVLDTMRRESSYESRSVGMTLTWASMPLPTGSVGFGETTEKSGVVKFISGVTGESVKVTTKKLLYNIAQITGRKELEIAAEEIEITQKLNGYNDRSVEEIELGLSVSPTGKLKPDIGVRIENNDDVFSIYLSPDVIGGVQDIASALGKMLDNVSAKRIELAETDKAIEQILDKIGRADVAPEEKQQAQEEVKVYAERSKSEIRSEKDQNDWHYSNEERKQANDEASKKVKEKYKTNPQKRKEYTHQYLDEHPIEGNIGALASGKKYNELSYEEKLATREYVDHRREENADIRAETENILLKEAKSTYIKWAAKKAQDGLQWYAEFAAKHPMLARWGFSVVNAVVETIIAGPAGAINAVRSEIGGVVLDGVAGEEIEAVFTAVTHKGAGLLQEKNPELTYDEAAALAALGTIATISAGSSLASKIGPILKKWDLKHVKKPAEGKGPQHGEHTYGEKCDVKKTEEYIGKLPDELNLITPDFDIVFLSASEAYKGSTKLGHALSKHAGRNPEIWSKIKGPPQTWHAQATEHLQNIIDGPGSFQKITNSKDGISWLEKRLPDGRGVRLRLDNTFEGFVD